MIALFCTVVLMGADVFANSPPDILVGAAKIDVTPKVPVVLAGYGGRSKVFEGIDTKLWARAMVIGDKKPVAIVAIDNCGVPRSATLRLVKRLSKHGITADRLVVAATHTHNAPNLVDYAPILWQGRTTPEQDRRTAQYTTFAIEQMEKAVVKALGNRRPMSLEWAQGRVTFGGNRRVVQGGRWAGFGFQRNGPVDHSLPVLAARDASGTVRVVWANYACHCTTVGSRNFVGGDWAGFASTWMEKEYPNATALMTIGCGADVGPQPSGNLKIAEQHGKSIAKEVRRLLSGKTTQLKDAPSVITKRIKLPLEKPKPRKYWEAQLRTTGWSHQLAKAMLKKADRAGSIPSEVDYPVSVWTFGDDLAMVFLAGEVVVDYSVRLKRELDWKRLWITAWANEMPGYIPSRRVLIEGGYEAEFSQVYYGQPGPYDLRVENVLVGTLKQLIGKPFAAGANQTKAPFHTLPSGEPLAFGRVAKWVAAKKTRDEAIVYEAIRRYLPLAKPGVDKGTQDGGEKSQWYNFAGDFTQRAFIRQQTIGAALRWKSSATAANRAAPLVLCFSGGVGWVGQPKTDGFELLINDTAKLKFDVTRKASRWTSEDKSVELVYLPTWTSDSDSAGFFFLVWPKPDKNDDRPRSISVRSLGKGSQRWFAIDSEQNMPARLKKLRAAFKQKK
jgi:hypothetical protein